MKSKRHSKILDLISEKTVETQEDLLSLLKREGFDVTQATVSRDIKELRLVKTLSPDGRYKYSSSAAKEDRNQMNDLKALVAKTVLSVDGAGNIIVVKTISGMAQGVCFTLDNMMMPGVVGTIAGDDTIFIAVSEAAKAAEISTELKKLL